MAHLDTAYKLGSLQAQVDFEQEIQKLAVDDMLPASPINVPSRQQVAAQARPAPAARTTPPASMTALPGREASVPPAAPATAAQHAAGAPRAFVNPGRLAGAAPATQRAAAQPMSFPPEVVNLSQPALARR